MSSHSTQPATGSAVIDSMAQAQRPTGPILALVISMGGYILAGTVPVFFPEMVDTKNGMSFGGQLIMTCSFIIWIAVLALWVRFKERRSVAAAFGFSASGSKQLALGAAAGLGLTALVVGVNLLLGTASMGSFNASALGLIAVLLIGFSIQATAEEIGYRTYMASAFARKWPIAAVVVAQAVVFTAGHVGNGLNIMAILVMLAVSYLLMTWILLTGNIWGAAAFHAVWNWSQGNVWGSHVSNLQVNTSLWTFTPAEGTDLLTGGAFGLEGSMLTLVILLVAAIALHLKYNASRRGEMR